MKINFDLLKQNSKNEFNRKLNIIEKILKKISQNFYNKNSWEFKYSENKISNMIYEQNNKSNRFNKYYFLENKNNRRKLSFLKN